MRKKNRRKIFKPNKKREKKNKPNIFGTYEYTKKKIPIMREHNYNKEKYQHLFINESFPIGLSP